MKKHTIIATSGVLLCAGSIFAQPHPSAMHPVRRRIVTGTPEQQAAATSRQEQCHTLNMAGFTALHNGQFSLAEDNARQALMISQNTDPLAPELLAASLNAQGEHIKALAAYKVLADQGSVFPRDMLPYALLLLKNGQWPEAVDAYNKAFPYIPSDQLMETKTTRFTTTDAEPTELATAIHIGLGLTYLSSADWAGNSQNDTGVLHFKRALELSPGSPLANYYMGFGFKQIGRHAEAQAAFKKAAALDDGDVKAAALKELPNAMKPR